MIPADYLANDDFVLSDRPLGGPAVGIRLINDGVISSCDVRRAIDGTKHTFIA